jgi:thioredoxin-related protein
MKQARYLLPILLAFVVMAFRLTGDPLPIGASMPAGDIKMKDVSGKIVSLNEVKTNHGLLVMFSCNTCPYVIKNQDRTKQILSHAAAQKIGVIVLNSNEAYRSGEDSYAAMKTYALEQNYQWFYTVDSNHSIADAFGANRTPECFLFDKDGKLVYHGAIDDSPTDATKVTRNHLHIAIDELSSQKTIAVKESKSVGCTIKRKS